MITGKSGGSGKYSYRGRSSGACSVQVFHMPEDNFKYRIVFKYNEEPSVPVLKLSETEAELLWASLKDIASDMGWKDLETK